MAMARGMICRHDDSPGGAHTFVCVEDDEAPQVLVVEDTKEIRDIIVWLLRQSGYRALAAENGLAAQLLLATARPALIISDLNMPRCDGWELLSFCHRQHPDIPVMIVSSEGLGRHPEVERWAAGYVSKPFKFRAFRAEVERLISRAA